MPLGSDELGRYARQMAVQDWGVDGQERLASSRVFVAGAGGLGCAAAVHLVGAGVGELVICDGDVIERSNLNRQFLYTTDDLTRPKAPIAAERLRPLNPYVTVEPVFAEIDSDSAGELISGADLVLDCLDNPETRFVLNRAAVGSSIPMVYAAVSEFLGYLSFLDPPNTPCLECFVDRTPPPAEPAVPGCTSGALGALEAMEALKFLTGAGNNLQCRLLILDGGVPSADIVEITNDPACPACGHLHCALE